MQLLGTLSSPFVRKIRIVLAYKSILHEMIVDAPSQPGSHVTEFNPLGKVPVLIRDDGKPIYDSSVIAEFLDIIAPTPSLLPATGLERIAVRRWEALADGLLDAAVAIVTERRRDSDEQSPSWIQKQEGKIRNALATLSADLGDHAWCCGDTPTLADISTGVALGYLDFRLAEIDWRRLYPNLGRLYGVLQNWRAFAETVPPA